MFDADGCSAMRYRPKTGSTASLRRSTTMSATSGHLLRRWAALSRAASYAALAPFMSSAKSPFGNGSRLMISSIRKAGAVPADEDHAETGTEAGLMVRGVPRRAATISSRRDGASRRGTSTLKGA